MFHIELCNELLREVARSIFIRYRECLKKKNYSTRPNEAKYLCKRLRNYLHSVSVAGKKK